MVNLGCSVSVDNMSALFMTLAFGGVQCGQFTSQVYNVLCKRMLITMGFYFIPIPHFLGYEFILFDQNKKL